MSHAGHESHRRDGQQTGVGDPLSRLSVRDLIAELARVEESLRTTPALLTRPGGLIRNPARRPLLRREGAVINELATRRRERLSTRRRDDGASAARRGPPLD
jgi:hypothetical protein